MKLFVMDKRKEIIDYFSILKKRDSLGTSYLFIGEDYTLANDIFKLINCQNDLCFCGECWDCKAIDKSNHPDLFFVEPEGLTTKIDKIREGIRFLTLKSFRAKNKILVIKDAQSLSLGSSNAFLKTLEEPVKNSFIAIYTTKLEGLLPTIISRCRKIFLPFNEITEEESFLNDEVYTFLKGGQVDFKDRKKFGLFLNNFSDILLKYVVSKVKNQNNDLIETKGYEIFLKRFTIEKIQDMIDCVLKIYSTYNSVNIKLALNLIRMKFV